MDSLPREPEVAVVGAGIGGLVAASCLARSGREVAVLEANPRPGGCLASFRRRGAVFDACVDSVGSVFEADGSPGLLGRALEAAGVLGDVEWVELNPIRVQRFPGFEVVIPRGTDRLCEELEACFPTCRPALRDALGALSAIHARSRRALGFPARTAPLPQFRDQRFGAFLGRFPLPPEAAAAFGSYATFLGAEPTSVSTRAMSDLWMSYVEGGAWRVTGGFGRLVGALCDRISESGGVVASGCRVEGAERSASAWRLQTVRGEISARHLIWAAPPPGAGGRGALSSSFALLYALLSGPLGNLHPSTGIFPRSGLDFLGTPADPWAGAGGISVPVPRERKDPPGLCSAVLHWPVRAEALQGVPKDRTEGALRRLLAAAAPGSEVHWAEVATPGTLERRTGNPGGAAYGWAQSPSGLRGPPADGLLPAEIERAGHWSGLGGGVIPAALSGWRAARRLMGATL